MTGFEVVDVVAEPSLPRKRRVPARFETGTASGPANVEPI